MSYNAAMSACSAGHKTNLKFHQIQQIRKPRWIGVSCMMLSGTMMSAWILMAWSGFWQEAVQLLCEMKLAALAADLTTCANWRGDECESCCLQKVEGPCLTPTCIGVQSWPETFRFYPSKLFMYLLQSLASGSTGIAAPFKLAQLILSVRFQLRSSLLKEIGYVCRYNSAVNACGRHIEFICQIGET